MLKYFINFKGETDMEQRELTINAFKYGHRYLIDGVILYQLLSEKITSKRFKELVLLIFKNSVCKEPDAWKNRDNIIGEAYKVDYCFDPLALNFYENQIYRLMYRIRNAKTFEELGNLENNTIWSEDIEHLCYLMALGNALKLVRFKDKTKNSTEIEFNLKRLC